MNLSERPQLKICSHCKVSKTISEFHPNKTKFDGISCFCKSCQNEASRKHYLKNKDKMRERNKLTRIKRREQLLQLRDNPCTDCGRKYPSFVMEFDHREPDAKAFSIGKGGLSKSKGRVLTELAKCDLVCSNCHRIRTFARLA